MGSKHPKNVIPLDFCAKIEGGGKNAPPSILRSPVSSVRNARPRVFVKRLLCRHLAVSVSETGFWESPLSCIVHHSPVP